MCVYIYTYVYTNKCACKHTYHAFMYICTPHIHKYKLENAGTRKLSFAILFAYVCANIRIFIQRHTYVYVCVSCVNVYMHTAYAHQHPGKCQHAQAHIRHCTQYLNGEINKLRMFAFQERFYVCACMMYIYLQLTFAVVFVFARHGLILKSFHDFCNSLLVCVGGGVSVCVWV